MKTLTTLRRADVVDKYRRWLAVAVKETEKPIAHCERSRHCIKFEKLIGRGGSGFVIRVHFSDDHCNDFGLGAEDQLAMKVCDVGMLTHAGCNMFSDEVNQMLKYSQLAIQGVTVNFLQCVAYGINCCIFEDTAADDRNRDIHIVREMFKAEGSDEYDEEEVGDFLDDCSSGSFIVSNLVQGPSLDKVGPEYMFTPRQCFECVYSLLVSVYYFNKIPSDNHLDNYMSDMADEGLCAEIGGQYVCFSTFATIVHIDYGAMSDVSDLKWGRIAILHRFFPPAYKADLKRLLDSAITSGEKIYKLVDVFSDFKCSRPPPGCAVTSFRQSAPKRKYDQR